MYFLRKPPQMVLYPSIHMIETIPTTSPYDILSAIELWKYVFCYLVISN